MAYLNTDNLKEAFSSSGMAKFKQIIGSDTYNQTHPEVRKKVLSSMKDNKKENKQYHPN